MEEIFGHQFETEGGQIFYRREQKGPAIPVTVEERDAAIRTYVRRVRSLMVATVAGTIALTVAWAVLTTVSGYQAPLYSLGAIPILLGIFMVAMRDAANRAVAGFASRTPVRRERDKDEHLRAAYAKMTWGQIGLGVLVICVAVGHQALKTDVLHGWGRLWLVGLALALILAARSALRKWRYEQQTR